MREFEYKIRFKVDGIKSEDDEEGLMDKFYDLALALELDIFDECLEDLEFIKGKKQCRSCGEWKLTSLFHKDSQKKDGLRLYCKDCYKEMANFYRGNKEKEKMMWAAMEMGGMLK